MTSNSNSEPLGRPDARSIFSHPTAGMRIIEAMALDTIGMGCANELPDLAAQALAEGIDSPTLRELAGYSRDSFPENLRDTLYRSCYELDINTPTTAEARLWLAYRWSSQAVAGKITAPEASWLIYRNVHLDRAEISASLPVAPIDLIDRLVVLSLVADTNRPPDLAPYERAFYDAATELVERVEHHDALPWP